MTQTGIPVPGGYVITSDAFEYFLEKADLKAEIDSILHSVNHEVVHTVDDASEKIRAIIELAQIPNEITEEINKSFLKLGAEYVAVRSSATSEDSADAAWAGQLETYLNTTNTQLLDHVRKCWSSLFTPRAIFYRFEKGLHGKQISVAVVVQKMVNSEKSGIAFSVHPVTQDPNQLIIEAGFGLGEAIVSGQVTPDSYIVEKDSNEIIDKNINEQTQALVRGEHGDNVWEDLGEKGARSVLNNNQVLELSEIIMKIESHYGFPCDIEWAFENNKFFITQSRPITTLDKNIRVGLSSGVATIFKNRIIWEKIYSRPHNIQRTQFLLPFFFGGLPNDLPIRLNYMIAVPNIGKYDYFMDASEWDHLLNQMSDFLLSETTKQHENKMRKRFSDYEAIGAEIKNIDLHGWSKDELLNWFERYSKAYIQITPYVYTPWAVDYKLADRLKTILRNIDAQKADEWFETISTPTELNQMLVQQQELFELAANNRLNYIDGFVEKYKWLTVYNIGDPVMTKEQILEQLKSVDSPTHALNERENEFKARTIRYEQTLKEINADELTRRIIDTIHLYTLLRDDRVDYWRRTLMYIEPFYKAIAELSGLTVRDVLEMTSNEIIEYLRNGSLPENVKDRATAHALIIDHENLRIETDPQLIKAIIEEVTAKQKQTKVLLGLCAYPGVVTGVARVIQDNRNISELQDGEVLVAYHTEPSHVVAMKKASAIVTDEGGITSHAAIVSRELKIPCVTATRFGSITIKTGDMVEVDAVNGVVRIIN